MPGPGATEIDAEWAKFDMGGNLRCPYSLGEPGTGMLLFFCWRRLQPGQAPWRQPTWRWSCQELTPRAQDRPGCRLVGSRVVSELHKPRASCEWARGAAYNYVGDRERAALWGARGPVVQENVWLEAQYGLKGYRRMTGLGWRVNNKRLERIWQAKGLRIPLTHQERAWRRLWLNKGSCVRLQPQERNLVWSYGFLRARMSDGRLLSFLTVLDEYTRRVLGHRHRPKYHVHFLPPARRFSRWS